MTRVRPGRETDESALRALQCHLREPSPDLLAHGLRVGDVLVSVAGEGSDDARSVDGRPSDQRPVGYVLPVPGGTDGSVHVAELVVHPDHRREGRAAELLGRVLADADARVTLLVAPENDAALALYRDLGFAVAGRRPGFYDGGDALVMAREPSDG
ncbi:GNAT family N-acetyltransferase [Halorarum salinum]|uniref:GNAT family N-acetyltransferase n=1 Tax=Halorarum salinum TaxID=2743089 RepID=A0A7D5QA82_9EURY|nr:N-acetyltransferase [Halobaculum salinum]QLG61558.1 GNAT family N-acetyltransferase [Halobaculum salinum]